MKTTELTSRELDVALAERLFGWRRYRPGWRARNNKYWEDVPHYSTTGDGMLLVLEAMGERGHGFNIYGRAGQAYGCYFDEVEVSGSGNADTLPRAVALAALARWNGRCRHERGAECPAREGGVSDYRPDEVTPKMRRAVHREEREVCLEQAVANIGYQPWAEFCDIKKRLAGLERERADWPKNALVAEKARARCVVEIRQLEERLAKAEGQRDMAYVSPGRCGCGHLNESCLLPDKEEATP